MVTKPLKARLFKRW